MTSSASVSSPARRSSRRPDEYDPSSGLSTDETAFGVLRQCVLRDEFKPMKDPDNVMKKIWVRTGKEKEDDGDGVDWVKEDGFTVAKYEQFWRTEMAGMDDVIVEWGHKLPAEAKAHLPEELFKDDDVDKAVTPAEADANDTGDNAGKDDTENKKKRGRPKKQKTDDTGDNAGKDDTKIKKKRGRPKKLKTDHAGDNAGKEDTKIKKKRGRPKKHKTEEAANDDEDGLTPELLVSREEWFGLLEGGRRANQASSSQEEAEKPESATTTTTSFKEKKERADDSKNLFLLNASGCTEMKQYKKESLDPAAKRAIAQVDQYVSNQAATLRNELLESLCMTNYKFTEED